TAHGVPVGRPTIAALAGSAVGSSRLTRSGTGRATIGSAGGRLTSGAFAFTPGVSGRTGFDGTASAPTPRPTGTRSGGAVRFSPAAFAGSTGGAAYTARPTGSGEAIFAGTGRASGACPNRLAGSGSGGAGVTTRGSARPAASAGN